jgi:hypothetical protein
MGHVLGGRGGFPLAGELQGVRVVAVPKRHGSRKVRGHRLALRLQGLQHSGAVFTTMALAPATIRARHGSAPITSSCGLLRDPERDAEFWSRKITEADVERRGYHRLVVKGYMTDEDLSTALSELDEIRETAERELEAARTRGEALERLERDRETLLESYAGMIGEAWRTSRPKSATGSTSCSGSAFASAQTRPWGFRSPSLRRPRMIYRTANIHHLAYKGSMNSREIEGAADLVR